MSTEPQVDQAVVDGLTRVYDREAAAIAGALRRAAADVEQHAARRRKNLRDLKPDFTGPAYDVLRDLRVLHANLDVTELLRAAANLDAYVRGGDLDA